MAVEWKIEYAVGYDYIDRQHQELFRRFNTLIEACRERRGREEIAKLLRFLDDYVDSHFADEERLMAAHAYPGEGEHLEQHETFRSELERLKAILEEEGTSVHLLVSTNEAVLQWLINHIRKTDTALGSFLSRRG